MSFVRFGEDDSDLYVLDDSSYGLRCCGCRFNDGAPFGGSASFGDDHAALLAHIAAHREAGHTVPSWLEGEVRADAAVEGPTTRREALRDA